jgi:hypothetical protein
LNQWQLITKRPTVFAALGLPCCENWASLNQYDGVLVDKQLLLQHDPLINSLPTAACFFIEPVQLDAAYDLVSEIVVPKSLLEGLFAGRNDDHERRVRVFHKSHQSLKSAVDIIDTGAASKK